MHITQWCSRFEYLYHGAAYPGLPSGSQPFIPNNTIPDFPSNSCSCCRPQTKLWEGNVFTRYLSAFPQSASGAGGTHRGVCSSLPALTQDTVNHCSGRYAHPTGMHSCFLIFTPAQTTVVANIMYFTGVCLFIGGQLPKMPWKQECIPVCL